MNKKDSKHNHHDSHKRRKHKKKISAFYKINLSLLLILSIVLFYFIILVSNKPKSIPYVTKTVETQLKAIFGQETTLDKTYINFTKYGTLKITTINLDISYKASESQVAQKFLIPKIEGEFSLLNLIFLKFYPSKLKIFDSKFIINNSHDFNESDEKYINHIPLINKFLSSVREKKFPIKILEIENASFVFKNENKTQEVFIKNSQIINKWKGGDLYIESLNQINFSKENPIVALNSNCQLSSDDYLKCDLLINNLVFESIANLHPKLNELSKIDAFFNVSAALVMHKREILNLSFKSEAKNGSFSFLDFFSQKIDFKNFIINGEYDDKVGALNLNNISADFISTSSLSPKLSMSLLISGLKSKINKRLDFYIKLQNTPIAELEKFWPTSLSQNDVRHWVISHIKDGEVKDSYAKFSLFCDEKSSRMEKIDAQLVFSDLNLTYDENFPEITNIAGIANFSKDAMQIMISNGKVLNSQIFDSSVVIENFAANKIMLKINGNSQGHAADSFKHINYKSSFANNLNKYLNGDSVNSFNIAIPLDNTNLKDSYISVKSNIKNLKNIYTQGDIEVISTKDFASNNFISNVNLSNAELKFDALDLKKDRGVDASLSFIVNTTNEKNILIKNILLLKKQSIKNKSNTEKIYGEFSFEANPFKTLSFDIKNSFGDNNYQISYKNSSKQKINIRGNKMNLGALIANNPFKNSNDGNIQNLQIQVALNKAKLLNNKNFKSLYFSLNCDDNFCNDGLLNAAYDNNGNGGLNLKMSKNANKNISMISGNIHDIGYLLEAMNISNLVSNGNAKIKMQNKLIDKGQVLSGEIEIDNNITIYENDKVKKLSQDNLFSKIKDTVFSNNKTIFDSVKIDLEIKNKILNIQSLVANNYKVGITAKGFFDTKNDSYNIKGMIIPGFIVNNLFGIGKIPILGSVVNGLLTGGEGGGLFGIRYEYVKSANDKEGQLKTYKISAFVPTAIKDLFN